MNDIDTYLGELRRQGYTVTRSRRRNHLFIRRGDELVAVASGTSSNRTSLRKLKANIRRWEKQRDAAI